MKKILVLLLVFVISGFPNLNVKAKQLPTIKVGSCYAYKDETVTIPITLENNKGFNYLGAKIRYNTDELEYVSSNIVGLANISLKKIDINKHNTITLYILTQDKLIYDNGKIANIKFKVLKDNIDKTPIEIQVDNFGKNNNDLEIKSENGNIKFSEHEVVNKTKKVKPTVKDAQNKKIVWTTSNKKIATIDNKGNIKFNKKGIVKVTGKDENGNIVFDKTYKVDKRDLEKSNNKTSYVMIIALLILLIVIILVVEKKKRKKL